MARKVCEDSPILHDLPGEARAEKKNGGSSESPFQAARPPNNAAAFQSPATSVAISATVTGW
jgi:hypothetical protein